VKAGPEWYNEAKRITKDDMISAQRKVPPRPSLPSPSPLRWRRCLRSAAG
jgi:hypothetical protein